MLSVKDCTPRRQRSTESAVEKLWAKTWSDMGLYSRHMSDHVPGLPDRYIASGKWVEFKSLYRVQGAFTYGEGLSPEQVRACRDLTYSGDSVFYCAQLDGWEHGKKYIFIPWRNMAARIGQFFQLDLWTREIFDATLENRKMLTTRFIHGTEVMRF